MSFSIAWTIRFACCGSRVRRRLSRISAPKLNALPIGIVNVRWSIYFFSFRFGGMLILLLIVFGEVVFSGFCSRKKMGI